MEVRLARLEEVKGIVLLEREVDVAPHWREEVYREMVEGGAVRRCLFVALAEEDQQMLAGFAVGGVAESVGEVESLAVREAERGRGAGRSLLRAVMDWCKAKGATMIELEVRAGGVAARRLYESVGFTVVGSRPAYYRDPVEDAVLMRWCSQSDAGWPHV